MIRGGKEIQIRALRKVASTGKNGPPYLIRKDRSKEINKTLAINPICAIFKMNTLLHCLTIFDCSKYFPPIIPEQETIRAIALRRPVKSYALSFKLVSEISDVPSLRA